MMANHAQAQNEGASPPLHILIADDEPTIVSALEKFLTRRGHAVMTAPDAKAAMLLVDEYRFDAALLDVRMPGGGLSVLEHLRNDPAFKGRVVLMTGALATDPEIPADPRVLRMQKPFRLSEVIVMVEGGDPR
jgi:DNA-binding response OmpR family regulator